MDSPAMEFRAYRTEYALETVTMWRRAFQRAMGLAEHDPHHAVADQLAYFSTVSPETVRVAMDPKSNDIVGMTVLDGGILQHLYVHVDYQGIGIGSTFLAEAKARSPTGMELFTFQRNVTAQGFYLSHGFVEIERGYADFEGNPWAESRDQLADIKYRWTPGG